MNFIRSDLIGLVLFRVTRLSLEAQQEAIKIYTDQMQLKPMPSLVEPRDVPGFPEKKSTVQVTTMLTDETLQELERDDFDLLGRQELNGQRRTPFPLFGSPKAGAHDALDL